MESTYSKLESPYTKLESTYGKLDSPYSKLDNPYSKLESPYSKLESPYSKLENPYSKLESPYTSSLTSQHFNNIKMDPQQGNNDFTNKNHHKNRNQSNITELQGWIVHPNPQLKGA